jgi:hypothetical protein
LNDLARLWADPRLVYSVAAASVVLLVVAIWLFGRRKRKGRQAGLICLVLSILFHLLLILLVPLLPAPPGGSSTVDPHSQDAAGVDSVAFSTFEPDLSPTESSGDIESMVAPLPVASLMDLLQPQPNAEPIDTEQTPVEPATETAPQLPESLVRSQAEPLADSLPELSSDLDRMLEDAFAQAPREETADAPTSPADEKVPAPNVAESSPITAASPAPSGTVVGSLESDFANRTGSAKQEALLRTGGSAQTEAAVEAALRYLVSLQRDDGAWDPRASGAGIERSPLGTSRGNAGSRAETALTGLALLSLMGAGHTHQQGEFSDNVYRGLAFLIRSQKADGSFAGNSSVYEATYCHGMAALAVGEAAAITRDSSAILSAQRAIAYTQRLQHPTTGGWRYTEGDPGDLSQLGWQAMVLDAGHRAGIALDPRSVTGVQRFLHSVRMGSYGGLASYRRGEAPSRTMTAEALATRLLIGQQVPPQEIAEAERYLLQQPPGVSQDNYYYWYYATLALHQLQDDAWTQWNQSLTQRLLSTQRADGSWSTDTVWGGYGGTVYTTSMAALCLETYYRHAIRADYRRIAQSQEATPRR